MMSDHVRKTYKRMGFRLDDGTVQNDQSIMLLYIADMLDKLGDKLLKPEQSEQGRAYSKYDEEIAAAFAEAKKRMSEELGVPIRSLETAGPSDITQIPDVRIT